jgi:hypothetical protein
MPEDMGGLLPGVMWNPDGRDRKTQAVLFALPETIKLPDLCNA